MINLIRCDDRLIHGQCMTRLVQAYFIKHIIVVDEFSASNQLMKRIMEKSAMPGMKNDVYSVQDSIEPIKKAVSDNVGTMVVFRFPPIAKTLFDSIEDLPKTLMIGPVQKKEGVETYTIQDGTFCTREDLEIFKYLTEEKGVEVFFQIVPDMKRTDWKTVAAKYSV